MCPNGHAILKDSVKRRFPADDSWVAWDDSRAYAYSSTVAELIQEIVQRHAEGIEFREYNAGPNLDMDMKDEGFNQKIWVDWKTGLIYGGNRYNCGTWMDKMGSSDRAGNKGLPATPRDGSPIEITGLLKSTLNWLHDLSSKGAFPFKGVTATSKSTSLIDGIEHTKDFPLCQSMARSERSPTSIGQTSSRRRLRSPTGSRNIRRRTLTSMSILDW